MIQRRSILLFVFAVTAGLIFLASFHTTTIKETWRGLPERVGLGESLETLEDPRFPELSQMSAYGLPKNWDPKTAFVEGESKPPGYNWTTMLVIAKTKEEDIGWVDDLLPDQRKTVYVADDPSAEYHPPKNKGHEVMIYLTYLIDHYEVLEDITMFIHAHRWTWHNNAIMGLDSAELIKRINPNRVVRAGYQNFRCHWHPGCPDWVHPGVTEVDGNKPEEVLLAHAWSELFPFEEVPDVLAQPCCSQFALSRERIHSIPKARFVFYRDWLLRTQLPDHLSGRIWEYMWQKVFTGRSYDCPVEWVCYCDGYGYCFGNSTISLQDGYDEWRHLDAEKRDWEGKLNHWRDLGKKIEEAKKDKKPQKEIDDMEKPEPGVNEEFEREINRLRPVVDGLIKDAERKGSDPKERARQLGRDWKEGDGF